MTDEIKTIRRSLENASSFDEFKDNMLAAIGCNHKRPTPMNPERAIRQILLELGSPDHLIGHPYVMQGILLVLEDRTYINNITFGLYPKLATIFNTKPTRVERAIRNLIEVTWARGDIDVLNKYFGNTVSAEKGKPTNGEFIARVANIIRDRM